MTPYLLTCPRCGGAVSIDLPTLATDWDDYDGCIGPMQEYRFEAVPLPCPHCGEAMTVNGTIYDSAGNRTGTLTAQ
jgi:predicted RNA-binding Zn-ribbon protein involved in translation (DUF1610 family)